MSAAGGRGALWALVGLLAAGLVLRVLAREAEGTGFATLPILTPTSLPYEAQMRSEAGQPAGQGGAEALALAEQLLAGPAPADPTLLAEVEALAADRAALLELRGRRHALNVRLMDVGVEVARRLEPAQWEAIHMRRDELRGQAEAAVFERALQRLRGPAPPPGAAPPTAPPGGSAPRPEPGSPAAPRRPRLEARPDQPRSGWP